MPVVGAILMLMVASLLTATASATSTQSTKGPYLIELDNVTCPVSVSPTTCSGGYKANQTFVNSLQVGQVVTVNFALLYSNSENVSMSVSDSLRNVFIIPSNQCTISSPTVCIAVGYSVITNPGLDDVLFSEIGDSAGVMWYNAEIWGGQIGSVVNSTGTSAYCAANCSGSIAVTPLNTTSNSGTIAESIAVAFYPTTPATWQATLHYSNAYSDCAGSGSTCQGGDGVLWQGTSSAFQKPPYTFSATTSPAPLVWGESAELIYWAR
ncbi:MAG: hypothetical protein JRM99_05980 [Nitrososphaerota archaeon]|nr:hypothetical protein [Nitrososphaerota archaeon]